MPGQGSPKNSRFFTPPVWAVCVIFLFGCLGGVYLLGEETSVGEVAPGEKPDGAESQVKFCLRIAWGGGSEQIWKGRIWVQPGALSDLQPLGLEADEPGSFWVEQGQLHIANRSVRSFDGVDVWVEAPLEARLWIDLKAADATEKSGGESGAWNVPLSRLASEDFSAELGSSGSRILIRRSPGDSLRVVLPGDCAVFSPGQMVPVQIQPYQLPVSPETPVEMEMQLTRSGSSEVLWSVRKEFTAGEKVPIRAEVPLESQEGVYELGIRVSTVGGRGWSLPLRSPLGGKTAITERRVQLVVIRSDRSEGIWQESRGFSVAAEIDPANPKWFERFAKLPGLPGLPRLWRGPLGNGRQDSWSHPLGPVCRLQPNPSPEDVSWEAYSLPITEPGKPHILEIRYPSDRPQTLGIRIVEPNNQGVVGPIGPESGIHLDEEVIGDGAAPRWLEHRMLFWPQTRTPIVLISNCRTDAPALYGRIRVLAGPDHLPPVLVSPPSAPGRRYYAYLHRPLFGKTFGAPESADSPPERGLEDWNTFYVGAVRMVEALRYGGYDGLVLPVLADGSSLYPSRLLQSTPRYDTGVLIDSGVDPVRKDVLEMMFRLFDREGIRLTPMLEFVSPLPSLEARCRAENPQTSGLRWIGPDGKAWNDVYPSYAGRAPYYNLLNEQVQEAMLEVIQEVVRRYHHHPAMEGLALQLSGWGYAQLLGPEWGLDDQTIGRFQRDVRVELPAAGANRFAERAKLLTGPHRQKWLQWRAGQLGKFYQKVDRVLKAARPDVHLYLLGGDLLAGPHWEEELRPVVGRRSSISELLLQVGLDVQHYQHPEGPFLVRPEPFTAAALRGRQVLYAEWTQLAEADQGFAAMPQAGSLFVHHPEKTFLPSFDQRSPFRSTQLTLWRQPALADRQNRRRFVQSLAALDSQVFFDGGWFFPLGGHESVQDLIVSYRRLPPIRFQEWSEGSSTQGASSQPCVIRYAYHEGYTYIYILNPTPLPLLARLQLEGVQSGRLEELSGRRSLRPLIMEQDGCIWTVDLETYDFLAVRIPGGKIRPVHAEVRAPASAVSRLEERIRLLSNRAALLRNPPAWRVLGNSGFEQPPTAEGTIPEWFTTRTPQTSIRVEDQGAHQGVRCVRLASEGPIACLVSRAFPTPSTGRFSMIVWLRIADPQRQPPLRLAVEWEKNGRQYRYASLGASAADSHAVPLTTDWVPYVFQVYDLPLDGAASMRIRFDLMGRGEVWIDDIQISGLAFSRDELIELSKLLTVATAKLERGELGDCIRLLEGYWPRFLQTYVGASPDSLSRRSPLSSPTATPETERSSNVLDRLKTFLPRPLRF